MNGHVFLEYMSFRMTCLMRAYVLKEGHALKEKMFCGRS